MPSEKDRRRFIQLISSGAIGSGLVGNASGSKSRNEQINIEDGKDDQQPPDLGVYNHSERELTISIIIRSGSRVVSRNEFNLRGALTRDLPESAQTNAVHNLSDDIQDFADSTDSIKIHATAESMETEEILVPLEGGQLSPLRSVTTWVNPDGELKIDQSIE